MPLVLRLPSPQQQQQQRRHHVIEILDSDSDYEQPAASATPTAPRTAPLDPDQHIDLVDDGEDNGCITPIHPMRSICTASWQTHAS
jgi:hypothetical protein